MDAILVPHPDGGFIPAGLAFPAAAGLAIPAVTAPSSLNPSSAGASASAPAVNPGVRNTLAAGNAVGVKSSAVTAPLVAIAPAVGLKPLAPAAVNAVGLKPSATNATLVADSLAPAVNELILNPPAAAAAAVVAADAANPFLADNEGWIFVVSKKKKKRATFKAEKHAEEDVLIVLPLAPREGLQLDYGEDDAVVWYTRTPRRAAMKWSMARKGGGFLYGSYGDNGLEF